MEIDMRDAWNRNSATYQSRHDIPTDTALYGPWAPTENELRLLGDVQGKRILEVGCGGGQCSIAFAKQGALAAGLDLSDEQLAFARELAAREGVSVPFIQGNAEDLSPFEDSSWDIVFSAYAFHYVENMDRCLAECHRVLRPGGLLAFSLDHPMRACFWDEEEQQETIYPVRSYFDERPLVWPFSETGILMRSFHRTTARWISLLAEAGFHLRTLLEPAPPKDISNDPWADEYTREIASKIPQTIIFLGEKP
jgi:ubiquinone/menaquinone biosynthesis C-methylase UbiE